MGETVSMHVIGHVRSDFATKFGIPRQSGLVESLRATVEFAPGYRSPDALRGIEGFSHLWLVWQFHQAVREGWSPTVRPPRLGGNERLGVFATRAPFRPNPIGLSCVGLERVELHPKRGPLLHVTGADLMDGTPILDIKPYLPYGDCRPEATGGFTDVRARHLLEVRCDPALLERLPEEKRAALLGVLERDPRPSYHSDPARVYGMTFAGLEVRFSVDGEVLTVRELQ